MDISPLALRLEVGPALEFQNKAVRTHVDDKTIAESEQTMLDNQLAVEDMFAWRSSFLEQTGTGITRDFVTNTARVAGHEPVILKSDDKDRQKMYDKVTKKYKKARKQVDKQKKQLQREKKARGSQYWYIAANQLSAPEHYEMLGDAGRRINAKFMDGLKQEKRKSYQTMYYNLQLGCETNASYLNQIHAYELLLEDREVMADEALRQETERRLAVLRERQVLAQKWTEDVYAAVKYATSDQWEVESELTDRGQEADSVRRFFGDSYRKKTDNSADVIAAQQIDYLKNMKVEQRMPTEKDNETEEDRQQIEEWVRAYYDEVNALEIEKYAAMGGMELKRHMRKIEEIGMISEWMRRLGERPCLGQADTSILSDYCNGRADGNLLAERLSLAGFCAKKVRFLWYVEALRREKLTVEDILPEDRWFEGTDKPQMWEVREKLEKEITSCSLLINNYLSRLNSRKELSGGR